jgi:ribosomal protein L44E
MKCPQCARMGRIVWVSQDGKTVGIKCSASHRQMSRPGSKLGSNARPQSKADRNMVFLLEIKLEE